MIIQFIINLINAFLALPLQSQIFVALIIASIIILGSYLLGFVGDIIILAVAILAAIFLLNFLIALI